MCVRAFCMCVSECVCGGGTSSSSNAAAAAAAAAVVVSNAITVPVML